MKRDRVEQKQRQACLKLTRLPWNNARHVLASVAVDSHMRKSACMTVVYKLCEYFVAYQVVEDMFLIWSKVDTLCN